MKNSPNFPLVHPQDDGIRPAGAPDECFYCKQKVGTPHLSDCVAVHQRVRLRLTVEVEVDQPHDWSPEEIEEFVEEDGCIEPGALEDGDIRRCRFIAVVDPTPRIKIRSPLDHQSELSENS